MILQIAATRYDWPYENFYKLDFSRIHIIIP